MPASRSPWTCAWGWWWAKLKLLPCSCPALWTETSGCEHGWAPGAGGPLLWCKRSLGGSCHACQQACRTQRVPKWGVSFGLGGVRAWSSGQEFDNVSCSSSDPGFNPSLFSYHLLLAIDCSKPPILALLRERTEPTRARGIKYLAGSRANYYLQNQIPTRCFLLRLKSIVHAICPHGKEGKKCISFRISGFTVRRDQRCRTCLSLAWCGFGICTSSVHCPRHPHINLFSDFNDISRWWSLASRCCMFLSWGLSICMCTRVRVPPELF